MKTVTVKYGGFSAEQEVDENLYNAIYQEGRKDGIEQNKKDVHDQIVNFCQTCYEDCWGCQVGNMNIK